MSSAYPWEDTLRSLGALLDDQPIQRPALVATAQGVHLQALADGSPLLEPLDETRLDAVRAKARQHRESEQGPNWTGLHLVRQGGGDMARPVGHKNYEATLREVGRYIERTGMQGWIAFETKNGYVLRGFVAKRRADGQGEVWEMEEAFWSNTELERIATEAVRLRERGA